jgi:glycosyltransferase involved in cell wall biosynthesis
VTHSSLPIDALVALKPRHPALRAVIAGEGYCRLDLEAQIRAARAEDWIGLPGRVDDDEVVDLYQRAWVLAMASSREGWGMIVTEAAACGTPAVVTRVPGFVDAVVEGRTGLLADTRDELTAGLDTVLSDPDLRARLGTGAREHAARYTWEATARGTLEVLAQAAIRRRTRP